VILDRNARVPCGRWQTLGVGCLLARPGNGYDRWRLGGVWILLDLVPDRFRCSPGDVDINLAVLFLALDFGRGQRRCWGVES